MNYNKRLKLFLRSFAENMLVGTGYLLMFLAIIAGFCLLQSTVYNLFRPEGLVHLTVFCICCVMYAIFVISVLNGIDSVRRAINEEDHY